MFNVLVLNKNPVRRVSNQPDGVCSQTNFLIDTLMPILWNSRSITPTLLKYRIKGAKTQFEEIPDILRIYNPEDVSVWKIIATMQKPRQPFKRFRMAALSGNS